MEKTKERSENKQTPRAYSLAKQDNNAPPIFEDFEEGGELECRYIPKIVNLLEN